MMKGIIFDIKRYAIHDGPGIRTTIFFKGCPMQCQWCHNPEGIANAREILYRPDLCKHCDDCIKICPDGAITNINHSKMIDVEKCDLCGKCIDICYTESLQFSGKEMTVQDVIEEIEKDTIFFDESNGGVSMSGGEPLFQIEFLHELLIQLKEREIHTVVDTSGYASFEAFEIIQDKVDLFLYDLKCMDDDRHQKCTGVSNKPILENLRLLDKNNNRIHIRIPLIPGVNDDLINIKASAEFISTLNNIDEIQLLPYHNLGESKFHRLNNPTFMIKNFESDNGKIDKIKRILQQYHLPVTIGG